MTLLCTRGISKRLKLTKTLREVYKHQDLDVLPAGINLSIPVLILSRDIIQLYSSVLLVNNFHFIVCSCVASEAEYKILKKLNPDIIWIQNMFMDEVSEISPLTDVLEYLKTRYSGKFDILSKNNIEIYLCELPIADVVLNDFQWKGETVSVGKAVPYLEAGGDSEEKGTLMMSPHNVEGEIVMKWGRIKVVGREALRGALHGDQVCAENGKIVKIIKRKLRTAVGTVLELRRLNDGVSVGFVRPIDKRLPDIHILTRNEGLLMKKVSVHVLEWDKDCETPRGVVFKILGESGDLQTEVGAIFENFSITYHSEPHEEITPNKFFSVQRAIDEMTAGNRRDLRNLEICSIDPPGCTDIDDALHYREIDGVIEVGVHIADVSFYVEPSTRLDEVAKDRSTTVYFPDRRIDMLPAFLSSDLCSLMENKDRAVISCVWRMDRDFNVLNTEIFHSVIRSRASLSYDEAWSIIQNNTENPLKNSLQHLLDIATVLKSRRLENGALELAKDEIRYKNGVLECKTAIPTHYLVEEFMLLANISIASYIFTNNPDYSLLRRHPLPSAIELDMVDATSSKTLNESIHKLDKDHAAIIKRVITRSMQQALYFSSGESSDFSHYGLATDLYTHFTSPIRRYPDLLVHRTLSYIFKNDYRLVDSLREAVNNKTCSWMNFRHRNAQNASRMADELFAVKCIRDEATKAHVVGIRPGKAVVFIPEYGLEATVEGNGYNVFDVLTVSISKDFKDYCINRSLNLTIENNI